MSNEQSNGVGEIKAAVIGFGLAGRVFHAPFVSAVPGLKLTSIVQRKGDEAAKAYPQATILRSFEEALDSEAELIVLGTPNETHYTLAKQALEAGKHVVVDKPFAATSEEARTLVDLAAAKKRVLAPFQNRRWDGDFLTVRDVLEHKDLEGVCQRLQRAVVRSGAAPARPGARAVRRSRGDHRQRAQGSRCLRH
jgi:scyllo-inositol 2-dehydrogenase (NADP+)